MHSLYTIRRHEINASIPGGKIFSQIDEILSLNPKGLNDWERQFLASLSGRKPWHRLSAKLLSCLRRILEKAIV